jgi:hypothetical protein
MPDIIYCAAFPKSGITYLNMMLFYALFDAPQDIAKFETDYVVDIHAYPAGVPPAGAVPRYVKTHSPYGASLALRDRADRAIQLVRDPTDVMMSLWDYIHLTGDEAFLNAPDEVRQKLFREFVDHWVASGGDPQRFAGIDFTGSWIDHLSSWLDQHELSTLFVRYEALKADPVNQLARIIAFLELPVPREKLEIAARKSSASEMKQQEQREIDARSARPGALYHPALTKAYDKGFRFVGKLHSGARNTVLTEAQRRDADRVFGSVLAQVDARIAGP